jgi:hypothetical protein
MPTSFPYKFVLSAILSQLHWFTVISAASTEGKC